MSICSAGSRLRPRHPLRAPDAAAQSWVFRARDALPDARHRRQHRRLQLDRRHPAASVSARGGAGAAVRHDRDGSRRPGNTDVSWPDCQDLQRNSTLVEAFIAEKITGTTLSVGDRAERAPGSIVSANYFDAIGVHPFSVAGSSPARTRAATRIRSP